MHRSCSRVAWLAACCALSVAAKQIENRIDAVTVSGPLGVAPSQVRGALRATRSRTVLPGIPSIWKGWRLKPAYTPEAVQADLLNLQSFYYEHGYLDAEARVDSIDSLRDKTRIAFAVDSGPRYEIRALHWTGPNGAFRTVPAGDLCRTFFQERRNAERAGRLQFDARIEFSDVSPLASAGPQSQVDAAAVIRPGPAFRVSRIGFRGNHSFRDATLRRILLFEEGKPLDKTLLRRSLARLDRTGWFEPLTQADVAVRAAPGTDLADVTISLKENKARHWSLSGPAGPTRIGGSLRLTVGSRLPPWGRALLELPTYTLSANLLLLAKPNMLPFLPRRRFIRLLTIERPSLPGQRLLSGFSIAPQLGWKGMLAGYAASQARSLIDSALETDRPFTPELPVAIAHAGREGTMTCRLPKTRLDWARQVGGNAVNLLFSFAPL